MALEEKRHREIVLIKGISLRWKGEGNEEKGERGWCTSRLGSEPQVQAEMAIGSPERQWPVGSRVCSLHDALVCTPRQDTEPLEPKGHGHRNEILKDDLCGPGSENQTRRPWWDLLQGPDGSQTPIIYPQSQGKGDRAPHLLMLSFYCPTRTRTWAEIK